MNNKGIVDLLQSRDLRKSHYLMQDYEDNDKLGGDGKMGKMQAQSGGGKQSDEDARWNELPDFGVGLFEGNSVALKRIWKKDVDFARVIRKEVLNVSQIYHRELQSANR